MTASLLQINPLENAPLGAKVTLPSDVTDPSKLREEDFQTLLRALKTYQVLVIPGQKNLSPKSQYELTKRCDPTCQGNYGHSKEFRHEKSVLRADGVTVPTQPQVQVLGQGHHHEHEGMMLIDLKHPSHVTFHKDPLSIEEIAKGDTRYYRWHIDSALYGLSPPVVTTLLGINCPNPEKRQRIRYDDGSGHTKNSAQAATAFISGENAFNLLSDEDKELALGAIVEYAPHPYIFISNAKAHSTGLTMISENKELSFDELPPWEPSKVKRLPMVWTNPVTGKHHLQIHGACVYKIETADGKVYTLEKARELTYRLMRPAIDPENVYTHDWNEGDLVMFHNQGVWHSVTGEFDDKGKRLMHQCNIASGFDPVCRKD
ncbi:hypothetical protein CANCADRAFT_1743 [Tortispora caseinolytica NRRL Y-17796]|uniref:TauD/TfdA-like domain-containing protein n=1 Tax=Tortispora caseinolytica NRRL Y-17796 TaxID=767744 RepID=A0A1E4TE33_9ASCO|nr:hypothetical protein CANCADRAFT_1743 [Tortispora caseinolytica NRRL Y-17796]